MGWQHGAAEIEELLRHGELQRVAADTTASADLLADARRHLASADLIRHHDPNAAFGLLYDAARKACSALLEGQGLRVTSKGGHIAVRQAVLAQFGQLPGGEVLRPFDRLRRRRHELDYPSGAAPADADEISEAAERAAAIVDHAERLAPHLPAF